MRNHQKVERSTVDLSGYPDLVVIYLGMRVNRLGGLRRVLKLGPQISKSVSDNPEGLLRHESLFFSLFPLHVGMRQYWRDFDALERWVRTMPHSSWWKEFLSDSGGTGFWHETYFMRGGMEAIYDDMPERIGLTSFSPVQVAKGPMFSARKRLGLAGDPPAPVVGEGEL